MTSDYLTSKSLYTYGMRVLDFSFLYYSWNTYTCSPAAGLHAPGRLEYGHDVPCHIIIDLYAVSLLCSLNFLTSDRIKCLLSMIMASFHVSGVGNGAKEHQTAWGT